MRSERRGDLHVAGFDTLIRVTTQIADAVRLDAEALSEEVCRRYGAIAACLTAMGKGPIRFWNYVPGILDSIAPGMDRYMAFNRGRHAAYTRAWGSGADFARSVPCASAVGITGSDLTIDCLASDRGGAPVGNPRQRESWRYSARYGPRPPCFARGTRTELAGRPVLLLAGTASIVGEESRHPGDVRAQVAEILDNIEAVIVNAGAPAGNALAQLSHARIYVVEAEDIGVVEAAVRARTGPAIRIESAVAHVCRRELLVEIEGVAALQSASGT